MSIDDEALGAEGADAEEGELRAGDLVVIPYPRVREEVGCAAEAGLVLEDRRSILRIHFPTGDRTVWVDRSKVEQVAAERLPLTPRIELLHRISRLADADGLELYDEKDGVGIYHVYSRGMDLDALHAIRSLLGDRLERLRIDPGSVRRVRLTLAFRA